MHIAGPSHFLVRFHVDDCLCVVARKYINDTDKLCVNEECQVKWNAKELLSATVIAMGDKAAMDRTEAELITGKEHERESEPQPKKATQRKEGDLSSDKENIQKRTPYRKTSTRKPLHKFRR